MSAISCIPIFGIPYVSASLEEAALHLAEQASSTQQPRLIAHSDVHVLTRILQDEQGYGKGMQNFDYICPDGMPIVWLLRRKRKESCRLYGPDMMEQVWDIGREHGLRHFLLGGSEHALAQLQGPFASRYPGIDIAGSYSPPMGEWPEGEHEKICQLIRESGANCVWVGLGCPKQEQWLYERKAQGALPPGLYFAVGAAFNFHAGLVQQAPKWIRNNGFEWLYRLVKEPRRLFKRYITHNSLFLWYLLTKKA